MSDYLGEVQLPWQTQQTGANNYTKPTVHLEQISELYATDKKEEDRTNFEETFSEEMYFDAHRNLYNSGSEFSGPYEFYNSLLNNREYLVNTLGIDNETYDALGCIALALASQETGMGFEDGYQEEQGGVLGFLRNAAIKLTSPNSASSGLTQLKIYDQISENFDRWHESLLKQKGVSAKGKVTDNLNDPQFSAIATMVTLKVIMDNYDDYQKALDNKYTEIEEGFINDGIDSKEAEQKGFDYLSDIYLAYQDMPEEQKKDVRESLKYLFLSQDGSTKESPAKDGEKYTEEIQFEKLKEALDDSVQLDDDALRYMRFAMCTTECQLDMTEYCAYAWNNGIKETGMQPDRAISEKLGIIFSDPEQFDYEHYSANVVSLAEKYAEQSTSQNGYDALQGILKDYKPQ